MSASAGLFVDSYEKNPVFLNYGIDELRFTKPMYAGSQLYIRFTCKEKIAQELKEPNPDIVMPRGADIPKGIVKWLVEMFDGADELVGIATILTMVENNSKVKIQK
jgi:oxepin-CoA hydrolase/3-oxo-5,6-dehydrosuberyl-CoA semialdehyde dehydrogenase